ncbi:MAG: sigma-54-dependent Fis family transcriptional regulator [Deltaproteobacteria bacterium]|nr:sigma-54-dependent Fis family transcriptional regulator [Deltaproteobacteria bacterium]
MVLSASRRADGPRTSPPSLPRPTSGGTPSPARGSRSTWPEAGPPSAALSQRAVRSCPGRPTSPEFLRRVGRRPPLRNIRHDCRHSHSPPPLPGMRSPDQTLRLVRTDIKMPGLDGMDLLRKIKECSPGTQVVVVTAFGTLEMALEAGAFEYVRKPYNRDELKRTVPKALRFRSLETENVRLRREVGRKFGFENLIGGSPEMQAVFRLIEKVADSEAGTGKELVARAIHHGSSRAEEPFVAINCAAIPRELLESKGWRLFFRAPALPAATEPVSRAEQGRGKVWPGS